jgi:hypothetical protein
MLVTLAGLIVVSGPFIFEGSRVIIQLGIGIPKILQKAENLKGVLPSEVEI